MKKEHKKIIKENALVVAEDLLETIDEEIAEEFGANGIVGIDLGDMKDDIVDEYADEYAVMFANEIRKTLKKLL